MPLESDNNRQRGTPGWSYAGQGDTVRFLCPKCNKSKRNLGRRLTRFMGVRTWVCAECAPTKEKTR